MKQIIPFASYQEAIQAFDNGGKFFNLLSHAKDGVVTPAELGKVAGVTFDRQEMILYLTMAISHLDEHSKERILAHLDEELFELYEKHSPVHSTIAQLAKEPKAGFSTVLMGTPCKVSTSQDFGGTIMVPVIVDAVTSFTIVPIVSAYEVYQMTCDKTGLKATVAHHKEKSPLPEKKLKLGGVLTSLSGKDGRDPLNQVFLEVQYYIEEE
jgi:hypothetical protein